MWKVLTGQKLGHFFALRRRRGKTAETAETAGFYVVF
jgi:hypothetical protein